MLGAMAKEIGLAEVREGCASGRLALLDVSLGEEFREGHIAGAKNARVFEVTFLEQVKGLGLEPAGALVVYGDGGGSAAAAMAAEKLERAGWGEVYVFAEGLPAWEAAGLPVERAEGARDDGKGYTGSASLDTKRSFVYWMGRNLVNSHNGRLFFEEGTMRFREGVLEGGRLVMDMAGMVCDDLTDGELNAGLIAHLKSDDFFDVERYPRARIEILEAGVIAGAKPGEPNTRVEADLELRGKRGRIEFVATIGPVDGETIAAQGNFDFDRTKWGVLYGSGKFFNRLGMHLVKDLVSVDLRLFLNAGGRGGI